MSEAAPERQRRYRRGLGAETIASAYLRTRGYRILARRFKTHLGEIDLIIEKRGRVAFVEVKRRDTRAGCEASITPRLRDRVRRAADLWLGRNARYQNHTIGFDVVFIIPWHLPQHIENGL